MTVKNLNRFGSLILLITFILSYYWYDWELVVLIVLSIWGSRMENYKKNNNDIEN